jgi:hypothetical protein
MISALMDRSGDWRLAVRRRWRLTLAQRKRCDHKGPTVQKRRRKRTQCNNRIKDREIRRQPCLKKERTSGRIFRKTVELEIEKRIVGSSAGPRGSVPSETEEETSKAQPSENNKDDGSPSGQARTLSGNCWGREALSSE